MTWQQILAKLCTGTSRQVEGEEGGNAGCEGEGEGGGEGGEGGDHGAGCELAVGSVLVWVLPGPA